MAGNIVPRTDGGSNLGTADKEFNVIYAKSFGGTIASQVVTTNSPTFTGTPAAPTAAAGTDTTQIATTAFANAAASAAASSAVSTHNLANDAHSATIAAAVNTHNAATDAHSTEFAKYLPLAGGTITGRVTSSAPAVDISKVNNTSVFEIFGGTNGTYKNGANLELYGADNSGIYAGGFIIRANSTDRTRHPEFIGTPNGVLTWGNKNVHRGDVVYNAGTVSVATATNTIIATCSLAPGTYIAIAGIEWETSFTNLCTAFVDVAGSVKSLVRGNGNAGGGFSLSCAFTVDSTSNLSITTYQSSGGSVNARWKYFIIPLY